MLVICYWDVDIIIIIIIIIINSIVWWAQATVQVLYTIKL
jgi:hypothetical protein